MAGQPPSGPPGAADLATVSQAVFRSALDAIAHPGKIVALSAVPEAIGCANPAAVALLMALADSDTPLWIDPTARTTALPDHLRFHCGCPVVDDPALAAFALATDPATCPPLSDFPVGTPEYPDRSATLILQVDQLSAGRGVRLTGPGIETQTSLAASALPPDFWAQVAANNALFPLGIDIFLADDRRIVALPRSVSVEF